MTCARLLNYPDEEGDSGRTLVPDVAADLPEVSNDGRTYTFAIRKGFRFSPPSTEEVTAESFRRAIERAALAEAVGDEPAASARQHRRRDRLPRGPGCARSGVSARDGKLVVRLREPAPDLPWLVAESTAPFPWQHRSSKAASRSPSPPPGRTTWRRSPTRSRC